MTRRPWNASRVRPGPPLSLTIPTSARFTKSVTARVSLHRHGVLGGPDPEARHCGGGVAGATSCSFTDRCCARATRAPTKGCPQQINTLLDPAIQIAHRLEATCRRHQTPRHQAGEYFRDPARRPRGGTGHAKILDYGLAEPPTTWPSPSGGLGGEGGERSEAGEGISPHGAPTLSVDPEALTRPGTTNGTVAYMSLGRVRGYVLDLYGLVPFGAPSSTRWRPDSKKTSRGRLEARHSVAYHCEQSHDQAARLGGTGGKM